MSRIEREDILRVSQSIGQVKPSHDATDRAIKNVSEVIKSNQRASSSRRIKRTIMKITIPSGIAAAILITIGLLLTVQTTQPASAAEQLEEIAKINNAYKGWIHITLESITSASTAQPVLTFGVIHYDTRDRTMGRIIEQGGVRMIQFYSPPQKQTQQYNSKTNELEINAWNAAASANMAGFAKLATVDGILELIKEHSEKKYTVVRSQTGQYDRFDIVVEKQAEVPFVAPGPKRATILVDPNTSLVHHLEADYRGDMTFSFTFTYGEPAIKDIYDLGVPRDAKVIDNRPTEDVKTILDRLGQRMEQGFGDYVATLAEVYQENGKPDEKFSAVHIFSRSGKAWLANRYLVGTKELPSGQSREAIDFPKDWPSPTLSELLEACSKIRPSEYQVTDGSRFWSMAQGELIGKARKIIPILAAKFSLPGMIWPTSARLYVATPGSRAQLITDAQRPGLIGLHIETKGTSRTTQATYWMDPARDDMPVESMGNETIKTSNGTVHKSEWKYKYLDHGQTAGGQWYPKRWRTISTHYGKTRTVEYHLQVFPDAKLGKEWFTNPAEEE